MGLGTWAPLVAGIRGRVWTWTLIGIAGPAVSVAGWVMMAHTSPAGDERAQRLATAGFVLVVVAWVGSIVASFAIRRAYDARRGLPPRPKTRWPQPTAASRQWSARYALAALAVAFAAILLVGLFLKHILGIDSLSIGAGVVIVDVILLTALVPLVRRRKLVAADLGLRPAPSLPSLGLVLLGVCAYLAVAMLWLIVFFHEATSHDAGQLSQTSGLHGFDRVLAIVAVAVIAPVVEEVFFRGLLYRSLRNRMSILPAVLLAGGLFGLVHITGYPLFTLPVKAAFGVIACLLYERTGSLYPGIALHMFVDASAIDLTFTGNDTIVLTIAGAVILVILVRAGIGRLRGGTPEPALTADAAAA